MIQDRLKIKKLRAGDLAPDVMLGRQTLLNCAAFKGWGQGCDGGEPLEVRRTGRFVVATWHKASGCSVVCVMCGECLFHKTGQTIWSRTFLPRVALACEPT